LLSRCFRVLVERWVPAGSYLYFANAILSNTSTAQRSVDCGLLRGPQAVETAAVTHGASGTPADTQTISMGIPVVFAVQSSLLLKCDASGSGVEWEDADLFAIQVENLKTTDAP
jgi:hypothetical protein